MKYSRREVRGKAYATPRLKFENQSLTSFSGLVVFQQFFALLRLKVRLARCFAHQTGKVFGRAILFLQLVLHLLLGYRELRESRYYQDDPLVKRLLGLRRLPDVATLSRMLKEADAKSVASLTGDDFNALFKPLQNRAHIIQYDKDNVILDDGGMKEVEESWAEKRGASFYFVVARASTDGDVAYNTDLSQQRAQAVYNHLQSKFTGDEDLKKVGLLWLGEEYAQLGQDFCTWSRSRDGVECTDKEINRSAFVAWIDCAI